VPAGRRLVAALPCAHAARCCTSTCTCRLGELPAGDLALFTSSCCHLLLQLCAHRVCTHVQDPAGVLARAGRHLLRNWLRAVRLLLMPLLAVLQAPKLTGQAVALLLVPLLALVLLTH
jgi:hypothetical protein